MKNNKLKILDGQFSIHRMSPDIVIPPQVYKSDFYSIVKTDDEVSIVCDSSIELRSEESNIGWTCFKFVGTLDFSLTGVLSRISSILADSKISIFALSTYNTDYILVESQNILETKKALIESGYIFYEGKDNE